MKILNINNIRQSCPPLSVKTTSEKIRTSNVFQRYSAGDVVSFTAKKYDADSVINPTNHCAYCGCKVYTEMQIEGIAKDMLSSKFDRLEGKIKSVLEKLEGAKHSQEIALAKCIENNEEIDFFKHLLELASKKSFLKFEAILEQVYGISKDDALELLIKNMHPLLRTIDHVSPQNEEKDNNNSDVNLVEACYCCNHDLKKGSSFNEFYTMFPSIKNNMPKEKFEYAIANLLDSSSSNVVQRLSVSNILRLIERLFIQRTETVNCLDSIDFRIKTCKSGIEDSINSCQTEIAEKKAEIAGLEDRLSELKKDDEYSAMLRRISLTSKLEDVKSAISSMRERRQRMSESINQLRNPQKSSKKQKSNELSDEEKAELIEKLKASIFSLEAQINAQEENALELSMDIEALDKEFPTIDMLQFQKNKAESIISAHISFNKEAASLVDYEAKKAELEAKEADLVLRISEMTAKSSEFNINEYPPEDRQLFERYQSLVEALEYANEHLKGTSVKSLINQSAKMQIEVEIASLENSSVIKEYQESIHRKELELQLEKIRKDITAVNIVIQKSQQQCENYERAFASTSLEEAQKQSNELSEAIRRLTDKSNYIKIPQRITALKAEITLLHQTISDLQSQIEKIDSVGKKD